VPIVLAFQLDRESHSGNAPRNIRDTVSC
jgi:hypothetical protein